MLNEQIQKQVGSLLSLLLLIVSVFFIVLTFSTIHKLNNPVPKEHTITVSGSGTANIIPDLAVVNFGVRTVADTTEEAQTENTEIMNATLEALREEGIADKDLQTSNYSLRENEVRDPETREWVNQGWIVQQTVEIKIRDNEKVGNVLALAAQLGITNVSGPSFQHDDVSEYEDAARMEAIADARAKAENLARALGVTLGEVTDYNEWSGGPPQPYYDFARSEALSDSVLESVPSPEIAPGEDELQMEVSVTFQIR